MRLYSKPGFVKRILEAGFHLEQLGADHFGHDRFSLHAIAPSSVLYVVQRPALQSAGGVGRQQPFDALLAVCGLGAEAELAVDDRAAQRAFGWLLVGSMRPDHAHRRGS